MLDGLPGPLGAGKAAAPPESGVLSGGEEGLEGGLHPRPGGHHRLDHPRDLLQDDRHGAEVEGERHHLPSRLPHQGHEALVGPQVGVAPAIDRLLGVPHQEEPRPLLRRAVEGDPAQEVALDAVGVLEFVHQELIDPPPHLPPHLGALGEESLRPGEEEVEGGDPLGAELALDPPEQGEERPAAVLQQLGVEAGELLDELDEGAGRDLQLPLDVAEEGGLGPLELPPPGLQVVDEVAREEVVAGRLQGRALGVLLQPREQVGDGVRDLLGVEDPPALGEAGGDQAVERLQGLPEAAAEGGQRLGTERVLGEDGGGEPPLEEGAQGLDDLRRAEAPDGQLQQVGAPGIAVAVAQGVLDGLADHLLQQMPLGVHRQVGMDARLQRIVRQEPAAEGVDGAHGQVVEGAEEGPRPPRALRAGGEDGGLEPVRRLSPGGEGGQLARGPARHLGRRRLGEGDRHDPPQHLGGDAVRPLLARAAPRPLGESPGGPLPPLAQGPGEEPADERGGLPRPRPRLEHQGDVEPGLRGPAGGAVPGEKVGAEVGGHAGSPPPEPSPPAPLPSPPALPRRARGEKRRMFLSRSPICSALSSSPSPGEGGREGTGEGARG